jgi:hypothetical protein
LGEKFGDDTGKVYLALSSSTVRDHVVEKDNLRDNLEDPPDFTLVPLSRIQPNLILTYSENDLRIRPSSPELPSSTSTTLSSPPQTHLTTALSFIPLHSIIVAVVQLVIDAYTF